MAVPDGNTITFNLTGRQSRAWLKQACEYLEVFQRSPEFQYVEVDRDMKEFITIRSNITGTNNTMRSLPGGQGSNFKNLRGMGIRLFGIFIDEAAFFDPAGIDVIAPLLALGAWLIMASSVNSGGARAGLMAMLDATLNGEEIVLELNWLRACDDCTQKGIDDRCTHIRQRPQFFQKRSDQAFLQALLKPFDGVYEREMQNRQDKPTITAVFHKEWIDMLKDPARQVKPLAMIPFVYTTLDPHGGGHSQAALISTIEWLDHETGALCVVVIIFLY